MKIAAVAQGHFNAWRTKMSNPTIDRAKGKVKEAVGIVTDDKKLESEGKIEQAGAAVREKAAEIKADVAEAVESVIDRIGAVASDIKDKVTGKG